MADLVSYHDRDGCIWYDGKLVPWREANTVCQLFLILTRGARDTLVKIELRATGQSALEIEYII
jgi:hypothetical protein